MKIKEYTPPKLFLRFFRWFCHPKLLKYIEGDLMELYDERIKQGGKRKADIRFIIDVFLLFRPGIVRSLIKYRSVNQYGMYKSYFKVGWRNLLRSKGYSSINIGGLALGITVTLLIGLWINDELSFNKYNRHYDRLAQVVQNVTNNGEVETWRTVPYPLAEELRNNYGDDFKRIAMAVQWGDHVLSIDTKKIMEKGGFFEKDAPEMLSLTMLQGSAHQDDNATVLLSAAAAKTFFGNEDPINKVIQIDDMPPVKVRGVYDDFPHNSTFYGLNFIAAYDLYYSNAEWIRTLEDPWRPNFTVLYVELNDHADFETVSARIKDAKLKKLNPDLAKKKPELFLHPMSQWHLYSEFKNGENVGGAIQYVWMFGSIGLFVLLLACINFMNLSTARYEKRAKEVGIRKTVGSDKKQLVFQFFSESLLTVFLAFIASLAITHMVTPFFNEVAGKQVTILWTNPSFWWVCCGFIIVTALLAGSYPAFYLSSFKPIRVLKGVFKAGRFSAAPRKVLVVLQFTVSVTLIIGTIIVYRQIQFAKDRPVGYSRANLISVPTMNSSIHDHFDAVKDELVKTGAIVSVAESESPMTNIWNSTSGFSWQGKDPDLSTNFAVVSASYDYGKTIAWEIKEGHDFSRDFPSDSSAVILNEAAVKFMDLKTPVGEVITWWGKPYTVIGIIHDMVIQSPYGEPQPVIYGLEEGAGNVVLIRLDPGATARDGLGRITEVFKKYNPDQPFQYKFVDEDYAKKFGNEERVGKLVGSFGLLAVLISCLGIFGLSSFTAEQRTKEIGIRKVMGATIVQLWQMLSKDFIVLVVIACFIAIPLAYYLLDKWLQNYTYHTNIPVWISVASVIGAVTITLLTVSYQAIRTAMMNPVKSLRSE